MSTADQARVPARAGRMPRVSLLEREAPLGVILLVPTVLVLGMFLAWPFIFGIWLSLTQSEIGEIGDFIGLGNYQFEAKDGIFLKALTNTFIYTGVTTVFKLSLGLIMALDVRSHLQRRQLGCGPCPHRRDRQLARHADHGDDGPDRRQRLERHALL